MSEEDLDRLAERVAKRVVAEIRISDKLIRLMSYEKVAIQLDTCVNTVRNLVEGGRLVPTYVTPRCPRISADQLNAFIRKNTG